MKYQISPLWTNAFVYMVFGRMVWNYIPDATLWRVPAWRFGYYFVILDIMCDHHSSYFCTVNTDTQVSG